MFDHSNETRLVVQSIVKAIICVVHWPSLMDQPLKLKIVLKAVVKFNPNIINEIRLQSTKKREIERQRGRA